MAEKDKKAPAKKPATTKPSATKVTVKQVAADKKQTVAKRKVRKQRTDKKPNIFVRIGGYFKGSWVELRQVHWPDRKSTWGLTIAVLLYSAFFVVLILLLDAAFKYLFEQILK